MLKTFRAAGFAAIAFLCSANGAFATDRDAAPTAAGAIAAATPVTVALPGPAVVEGPAPVAVLAPGVTGTATVRPTLASLVAEHLDAAVVDDQFECLASAVYYESRGEPLEGQLAVAEVILNRVRSGRFRGTVCDVVTQPSQFSFVRRGVIPAAPRESAAWHRAAAIAHIAINDLADATGDEALFFHATSISPRWGRPRVARIGNHIFYR